MFADDIDIFEESKEGVESSLEACRDALEKRGMKVNRSKTEYLCACIYAHVRGMMDGKELICKGMK